MYGSCRTELGKEADADGKWKNASGCGVVETLNPKGQGLETSLYGFVLKPVVGGQGGCAWCPVLGVVLGGLVLGS
jgi:hypothetical protein